MSEAMKRVQMRSEAYSVAAGLIEAMDLSQFWGDEIFEANNELDLEFFQKVVVAHLRIRGQSLAGSKSPFS